MRIPRTIKIGPHLYRVLRKTKAALGDDLGKCVFNNVEIWLLRGMEASKAREILIHEVLHACTYPTFCNDKKFSDEDFVESTAPVLLSVLRENPKLVAYLVE